jgi:hypothetical protein
MERRYRLGLGHRRNRFQSRIRQRMQPKDRERAEVSRLGLDRRSCFQCLFHRRQHRVPHILHQME